MFKSNEVITKTNQVNKQTKSEGTPHAFKTKRDLSETWVRRQDKGLLVRMHGGWPVYDDDR